MNPTKILIADDHEIFRKGIAAFLNNQEEFLIAGEAANGMEVCELMEHIEVDLILMDLHLPQLNGIEASLQISKKHPRVRIVGLSCETNEEEIYEMIQAGVRGYILKDSSMSELVLAIKAISNGGSYFSHNISLGLLGISRRLNAKVSKRYGLRNGLTKREMEILKYIANELTNKEIAEKLFISPRTVETHRRNLIQKLKVRNTVGLVKYFLNNTQKIRV